MFPQSNTVKSTKQNGKKGQISSAELWSAKLVKSIKGTPGKGRKLRCLTPESLKQLEGKSAALFVSVDSRDYTPEKLDAMLSALHNVGLNVSLIIVDSNCGLNHVDKDCSNMSDEEFGKEVLPLGEKRAQQWVKDCSYIINQYRIKYPRFVTVRYCSSKGIGDGIGKRIEDEQAYEEGIGFFKQLQNSEALLPEIDQTIKEHFYNKNPDSIQLSNSQIYIKKELPIYYAMAKLFNFIVYTSEETPVLRYVRKLIIKNQRAGYLQIEFTPVSHKDLSLKVVESKISRGGGIEKDIRSDNFAEIMSQLLMSSSSPSRISSNPCTNTKNGKFGIVGFPLRKSSSDGALYSKDGSIFKKRRALSIGSIPTKRMFFSTSLSGKYSSLTPERKLEKARKFICQRGDYITAFDLLMAVSVHKLPESMKIAYKQLLNYARLGMDMTLRSSVLEVPMDEGRISASEPSSLSL